MKPSRKCFRDVFFTISRKNNFFHHKGILKFLADGRDEKERQKIHTKKKWFFQKLKKKNIEKNWFSRKDSEKTRYMYFPTFCAMPKKNKLKSFSSRWLLDSCEKKTCFLFANPFTQSKILTELHRTMSSFRAKTGETLSFQRFSKGFIEKYFIEKRLAHFAFWDYFLFKTPNDFRKNPVKMATLKLWAVRTHMNTANTHTNTNPPPQTPQKRKKNTHPHTHTLYIYTHTHAYIHTHTYTHTHTYIHTPTHTHTHMGKK